MKKRSTNINKTDQLGFLLLVFKQTNKTQSQNMKILSLLVFLILLSTNCANETSSLSTSGYSLDPTENYPSSTNPIESTNSTTVTKPTVDVETMELTSGLIPFKACEELLRYFQDEALERVGPYGLEGMGWGPIMPMALRMEDSLACLLYTSPSPRD